MGWFSPVKGSYPSLAQVDKTLPVDSGYDVKRGMIVMLSTDAEGNVVWTKPEGASTDKLLYVALTDAKDPTAGYAGTSFVPNPTKDFPARAAVTAIDLAQDGEYETSVFDPAGTYTVGAGLKATSNGLLSTTGDGPVVGYVTAAPASRWINNAVAVPKGVDPRLAYRTGAREKVIRFKTAV